MTYYTYDINGVLVKIFEWKGGIIMNINDVARLAKVSKATVSNVFNEKSNVSGEVRRRVLRVADEIGYYPNKIASALTTKKTGLVGLFLDTDSTFREMDKQLIEGISLELNKLQRHVILYLESKYDESFDHQDINKKIITEPIDDAIIVAPMIQDIRIEELISLKKNIILIGKAASSLVDVRSVDVDNIKITYQVTKMVIDKGHKKIALINSGSNLTVSIDRMKGYLKAIQEVGIDYNPEITFNSNNTEDMGYELAKRILQSTEATVIICSSDLVASGVYKATRELGLSIPDDISVIALGGMDRQLFPALSTVYVDYEELGKKAVKLLTSEESGVNKVIDSYEIIMLDSVGDIEL